MPQAVRRLIALELCERWDLIPTEEFLSAVLPTPRELFLCGGWQGSKSTATAFIIGLDIITRIYGDSGRIPGLKKTDDRVYRYWFVLPSYQTKPKEMDYLLRWFTKLGLVSSSGPHVQGSKDFSSGNSCFIHVLGGKYVIETQTAKDPEGIASEACDIVAACEAAQQPPIVQQQVQGRIMTFNGRAIYSGTLERPEWAWYEDAVSLYLDHPDAGHMAISLPSWANPVYIKGPFCHDRGGFCEIETHPQGCENHDHGRSHPHILDQAENLGPFAFSRKIAGVPKGTENPVYPWLRRDGFFDQPHVPEGAVWLRYQGAGGQDYGEGDGHPNVLGAATVGGIPVKGHIPDDIWIREVRWDNGYDMDWVKANRRELSAKYWIPQTRWGYDPMLRALAKSEGAQAVGGKRMERVGLVEARGMSRRIFFDMSGPGVAEAFDQMMRVHMVKTTGKDGATFFQYARVDDDMAAVVENIVWVVDSQPVRDFSGVLGGTFPSSRRRAPTITRGL